MEQGIMRATATATQGNFRLQNFVWQSHKTRVDNVVRRHFAPRSAPRRVYGRRVERSADQGCGL